MLVFVLKTFVLFLEDPNDILISEACDHSEMPHQIQRQRSESSISINSRISSSDISFSSSKKFITNVLFVM